MPAWTAHLPTCPAWQKAHAYLCSCSLCDGLPGMNMGRAARNSIVPQRLLPSRELLGCWECLQARPFRGTPCNICSDWQLPACRPSPGKAPIQQWWPGCLQAKSLEGKLAETEKRLRDLVQASQMQAAKARLEVSSHPPTPACSWVQQADACTHTLCQQL